MKNKDPRCKGGSLFTGQVMSSPDLDFSQHRRTGMPPGQGRLLFLGDFSFRLKQTDRAGKVLVHVTCRQANEEAEVSCLEIDTTLGLALSDVCEALNLEEEQMREVLGETAYQVTHEAPTPCTLPEFDLASLPSVNGRK